MRRHKKRDASYYEPERTASLGASGSLSQALKKYMYDQEVTGHKADLMSAAESVLSNRLMELEIRRRSQPMDGSKKASVRTRYNPFRDAPNWQTVFGTVADVRTDQRGPWRDRFRTPEIALPCRDRKRRREVLFATGQGGRGYRTPHKRKPESEIGC